MQTRMNAQEVLDSWSDIEEESDESDVSSDSEESESERDGDEEEPRAWKEVTGRFGGSIPVEITKHMNKNTLCR